MPAFNQRLLFAGLMFPIEGDHDLVIRIPSSVSQPITEDAPMNLDYLVLPGTATCIAVFVSAPSPGLSLRKSLHILTATFQQCVFAVYIQTTSRPAERFVSSKAACPG